MIPINKKLDKNNAVPCKKYNIIDILSVDNQIFFQRGFIRRDIGINDIIIVKNNLNIYF